MIKRIISKKISGYLASESKKILFIWGPRRSGKTTTLNKIAKETNSRIFNFDYISDQELFKPTRESLAALVQDNKIILIDEVQNYPESTRVLKLLHDEFNVKVIATGSSELRQKSGDFDSLAGRFIEYYCFPISLNEFTQNYDGSKVDQPAAERIFKTSSLVYGTYPEIYTSSSDLEKVNLLKSIFEQYVLKDIINIYELKNLKLARDLLTKIALQVGSEVSMNELASTLGVSVPTISSYLEIYMKNYILIELPSFKTNQRRAVSANRKYYFYDLGLRNYLINDFRDIEMRPDKGLVFENYVVSEIFKEIRNSDLLLKPYFYREYSGAEVDIVIEDYKKNYFGIEVKFNKTDIKKVFPLEHTLLQANFDNLSSIISHLK